MASLGMAASARTKIWAIAVLAAFLLGLVPMWISASRKATQIDGLQYEQRKSSLKESVAAAALYGKRGEYEPSRQAASEFFSALTARLDSGDTRSQPERDLLTRLLQERDQVITLLARSDPAGVERLFQIQHEVMQALP